MIDDYIESIKIKEKTIWRLRMSELLIKETEEAVVVEQEGKKLVIPIPFRDNYEEIVGESDSDAETTIYKDIVEWLNDTLEDEEIQMEDAQFEQLARLLCEKNLALL